MKRFTVKFEDEFEADTVEDAYEEVLKYLSDVVHYADVTAFNFEELGK